jgi:hypothetical protein
VVVEVVPVSVPDSLLPEPGPIDEPVIPDDAAVEPEDMDPAPESVATPLPSPKVADEVLCASGSPVVPGWDCSTANTASTSDAQPKEMTTQMIQMWRIA